MTDQAMRERKRANNARRLNAIRKQFELPSISRVKQQQLLDALDGLHGDGIDDRDLRVLYSLVCRGLDLR